MTSKENGNKKTIWLHVGMHKTATSSIQRTLFANREILEKNDYYYSKDLPLNNGRALHSLFCDDPSQYWVNVISNRNSSDCLVLNQKYQQCIKSELSLTSCDNIVFSGEGLCILTKENIQQMKCFFLNYFENIQFKVIVYVREKISYITSLKNQIEKGGGVVSSGDINEWSSTRFKFCIGKFLDVFGKDNVQVYKFEEACKYPLGPVGHFLNILKLPQQAINQIKVNRGNDSVSDVAIECSQFINARQPMFIKNVLNPLRYRNDTALIEAIPGKKSLLTKNETELVIENGVEDAKWLKENFAIKYHIDELKFSDVTLLSSKDIEYFYYSVEYLSIPLQKMVYEYLVEKRDKKELEDKNDYAQLSELIQWVERNFGSEIQMDLMSLESPFGKKDVPIQKFESMLKNQKLSCKADIFREVALLCEDYSFIDAAQGFMKEARRFRTNGPFIIQKINEYESLINYKPNSSAVNIPLPLNIQKSSMIKKVIYCLLFDRARIKTKCYGKRTLRFK